MDADRMKTTYQIDYSDPGEYGKNILKYIIRRYHTFIDTTFYYYY